MEKFGNITLINGDCMDFMRTQSDKSFDLSIVDPPYGIGEDGSKNYSRGNLAKSKKYKPYCNGDKKPSKEYFEQLFRVSKNQIIWGANHFIENFAKNSPAWIIWDKQNGATDFADCELAYSSFKKAARMFTFRWAGMLQGNMKHKEQRIHPNQKPVELYKWLLMEYAKEGNKILDTHLGSGSICLACHDYGFEMTGIELDADYYDGARKRLMNHQAQQRLFTNHSFISKDVEIFN